MYGKQRLAKLAFVLLLMLLISVKEAITSVVTFTIDSTAIVFPRLSAPAEDDFIREPEGAQEENPKNKYFSPSIETSFKFLSPSIEPKILPIEGNIESRILSTETGDIDVSLIRFGSSQKLRKHSFEEGE